MNERPFITLSNPHGSPVLIAFDSIEAISEDPAQEHGVVLVRGNWLPVSENAKEIVRLMADVLDVD